MLSAITQLVKSWPLTPETDGSRQLTGVCYLVDTWLGPKLYDDCDLLVHHRILAKAL